MQIGDNSINGANGAPAAKPVDPTKVTAICALLQSAGHDPFAVILAGIGAVSTLPSITFREAAARVVERAATEGGGVRPVTLGNYKTAYAIFDKVFGNRPVDKITTTEVKSFLDGMNNNRRKPGQATRNSKRSYLTYFKAALRAGGVRDPLIELRYRYEAKEIRFFSVEVVRALFAATPGRERGLLALALFAGIRPELLGRLPARCVDVARREITIPAHLSKDKRPHILRGEFTRPDGQLLPGLPETLWIWLRAFPFKPAPWLNLRLRLQRELARLETGSRDTSKGRSPYWIQDGTRHTAASYYCALYGAEATAALLTHVGSGMSVTHYIGIAAREDATEFYGIAPSAVDFRPERAPYGHVKNVPKEEIAELIWKMPMSALARKFGCSLPGLFLRCKALGIARPNTGYWNRHRWRPPDSGACPAPGKTPPPPGDGGEVARAAASDSAAA